MIIGNGLLANSIQDCFKREKLQYDKYLIFASGVSNSSENNSSAFTREQLMLEKLIAENNDKTIVYFSSCALIDEKNLLFAYYKHKENMENLVKKTNNFLILRLPQVVGYSDNKNTILNFFINAIKSNKKLVIKKYAYRYFIGVDDVSNFLFSLVENNVKNVKFDFANPYRYSVVDVVGIVSKILNKNYVNYEVLDEFDGYELNFTKMTEFMKMHQVNFDFSEKYLEKKIKKLYSEKL